MMMMMMMMMMMKNCFSGIVDRRKTFSFFSSRDYCQRSSPSRISYTPLAEFEPADFVESCTVVITTTDLLKQNRPNSNSFQIQHLLKLYKKSKKLQNSLDFDDVTK